MVLKCTNLAGLPAPSLEKVTLPYATPRFVVTAQVPHRPVSYASFISLPTWCLNFCTGSLTMMRNMCFSAETASGRKVFRAQSFF